MWLMGGGRRRLTFLRWALPEWAVGGTDHLCSAACDSSCGAWHHSLQVNKASSFIQCSGSVSFLSFFYLTCHFRSPAPLSPNITFCGVQSFLQWKIATAPLYLHLPFFHTQNKVLNAYSFATVAYSEFWKVTYFLIVVDYPTDTSAGAPLRTNSVA